MDDIFELIIDVQQKGVRATEADIESLDKALTDLTNSGALSTDQFKDLKKVITYLTGEMQKQKSSLTDGKAQWEGFLKVVKENKKAAEDLAAAQDRINKSRAEVGQAQQDRGIEKEIADLSRLEAAEKRVANARKELYNSNRQVKRADESGDLQRIEAALNRQKKAVDQVTKAEVNLSNVRKQDATAQEKAQQRREAIAAQEEKRIAQAEKRLAGAEGKQGLENQVRELDKVEAAQQRVSAAQERVAQTAEAVNRARADGSADGIVAALNDQTRATNDLTTAQNQLKATQEDAARVQNSLRYANYDLARSMFTVSTAITAGLTGTVVASAQYESAFTRVERTSGVTGKALADLEKDFLGLARTIPQTFDELTDIGARGAQLGILSGELSEFTEVVAQFVATSDTVTLDQAVEAFGRISNLLGEKDFNRLGSAITLVGVNAAATEAQIIKTTQELAPLANAIGMTTQDTIGLATALASLGQPPERVRSAFLTLQATMDKAVAGVNDKLSNFATFLGVAEEEAARLWKTDPGAFIASFSRALGATDNLTTAFMDLGISEKRAIQVFTALASDAKNAGDGISVLEQALSDSAQGFEEGTELQRQYGLILDDLSSKWQIFKNSLMEAVSVVGDQFAPTIKLVLDLLTDMVQGFSDFAATDLGGVIIKVVGAVSLLAAGYTALRGAVALATGTMLGFRTVTAAIGGPGIIAGLQALNTQFMALFASSGTATASVAGTNVALTGTAASSAGAASGLLGVRIALTRLLAATGVGALLVLIGSILVDLRGSALWTIDAIQWLGDSFGAAASPMGFAVGVFYGLVEALGHLAGSSLSAGEIIRYGIEGIIHAVSVVAQVIPLAFQIVHQVVSESLQNIVGILKLMGAAILTIPIAIRDGLSKVFGFLEPFFAIVLTQVQNFVQGILDFLSPLTGAIGAFFSGFQEGISDFSNAFNSSLSSARKWAQGLPSLVGGMDDLLNSAGAFKGVLDEFPDSFDDFAAGAGDAGGAMGGLAQEIRTVKDYASDLQSVFNRAFEIRFSAGSSRDAITATFIAMKEAADAAARSIQKLKADIGSLQEDIKLQEYFLSIALEYKDFDRASAIQANLAKLQSELADKTAQLREEQSKNSKELTGNSKAAIENRKKMEDLVKKYQDHIVALAASGMGQADLARETERLRQDFIKQATQLGYSRAEVDKFARAFLDMGEIIRAVPRNVNIEISGLGAAKAALKEFESRISSTMRSARNSIGGGISIPVRGHLDKSAKDALFTQWATAAQKQYGRALAQSASGWAEVRRLWEAGAYSQYGWSSGGFTGRGGVNEPAGTVHRGEYVIPQRDVNQRTGLPHADALGRLMNGTPGPTRAATTSSRSSSNQGQFIASFGPMAQQQLQQALRQVINLDGTTISNNSAKHYAQQNRAGAN